MVRYFEVKRQHSFHSAEVCKTIDVALDNIEVLSQRRSRVARHGTSESEAPFVQVNNMPVGRYWLVTTKEI